MKKILITGGHGFIGSHVAERLFQDRENLRISIVDTSSQSFLPGVICDTFIQGDICDFRICQRIVRDVDIVLHFAATMGGMGTIHGQNDFKIYRENTLMTLNILEASAQAGVKQFLFASSACVYPEYLQGANVNESDVSLKESDVWTTCHLPRPQGLYGLQKLQAELLVQAIGERNDIDIRIARFHNIYGPGGAWSSGREKVPAALLRKAYAWKHLAKMEDRPDGTSPFVEVWGDGNQRRSFLFIDDAVEAILSLLKSRYTLPLNIGSNIAVTVDHLTHVALSCAGMENIRLWYDQTKPRGVESRNSNNDLVMATLNWMPRISLHDGMKATGLWVEQEMERVLQGCNSLAERRETLTAFTKSSVLDLESETSETFAILLPITSRGTSSPADCLANLSRFVSALLETTWRDCAPGTGHFRTKIFLVIDHDDGYLLESSDGTDKPTMILRQAGILDSTTIVSYASHGQLCDIWRQAAHRAYTDSSQCDYFVLMGDDVILEDEGWMRTTREEFTRMASSGLPFGFGCVVFKDVSFPGMPTFPIIHRNHLEIFQGTVVPEDFVNQDGDPFLFQLYRRWGCSVMMEKRISNGIGGSGGARYQKEHLHDWTSRPLHRAIETVRGWLKNHGFSHTSEKLVLDVIIPSYRVNLDDLGTILELKPSVTCTVMFIIIIDNPQSPHTPILEARYAARLDVRIRMNDTNLGASESRNRGMQESAADFLLFLDDDVVPRADLLIQLEKAIQRSPNAAGIVGTSVLPKSNTVFTTAVRLSGLVYFWDIARNQAFATDVPWGVTANLAIKRHPGSNIFFDKGFPKTGGGEDVDFCRKQRASSINKDGAAFVAGPEVVVEHPWWNHGKRSYSRFYMWAYGDGGLVKRYPELSYWDFPNSSELLLVSFAGLFAAMLLGNRRGVILFLKAFSTIILANVLHDCYTHLWKESNGGENILLKARGAVWLLAVVESSFIRMMSEAGRLHGILYRRELRSLGMRFDWFTGRLASAPRVQRKNNIQRLVMAGFLMALIA